MSVEGTRGENREQGERGQAGDRRGDRQDYTGLEDHVEKLDGILSIRWKIIQGIEKWGTIIQLAFLKNHSGIWAETGLGGSKGASRDRGQEISRSRLGTGNCGLDWRGGCKE